MVDESIKVILNNKQSNLKFKALLAFMEDTGISFKNKKMKGPVGIATFYCIYLDMDHLNKHNEIYMFFVILHEIGHYKRIDKVGKEHVIKMLSLEDFDIFCNHIINEEIIADRYACILYQHFNKSVFPRGATQLLHLEYNQDRYKNTAKQLFGTIQNKEENYIKLLDSFLNE